MHNIETFFFIFQNDHHDKSSFDMSQYKDIVSDSIPHTEYFIPVTFTLQLEV